MADPARRPPGLPDYPRIGPDEVRAAADGGLREAVERYEAALAGAAGPAGSVARAGGLAALLDGVSDAARTIWTGYGASGALALVHPDPDVRVLRLSLLRVQRWRLPVPIQRFRGAARRARGQQHLLLGIRGQ